MRKITTTQIIKYLRSFFMRKKFGYCHHTVRFEKLGKLIGAQYIQIRETSDIQYGTHLTAWDNYGNKPMIKIGKDCHIGAYNHITSINSIEIGDGFVSGMYVTITDNSHGYTDKETMDLPVSKRKVVSKGKVFIGDNVWIGDKATILPNVKIGNGAIIAANTVVTSDIPAYSVAAGNPAKIVRQN